MEKKKKEREGVERGRKKEGGKERVRKRSCIYK